MKASKKTALAARLTGGTIAITAGLALAGAAHAGGTWNGKHLRALHQHWVQDPQQASDNAAAAGGVALPADKQAALDLINAARAKARTCGGTAYGAAPAVAWSAPLETAAQRHSDDMASHNLFSHTGSDGSDPGARVTAAGYAWSTVGENIAAGYPTVQAVVDGWLKSPGHCSNIMNPRFKDIGLARQTNASSTYGSYWTLDLAAR